MGEIVIMPQIIEFNGLPGSGKTTVAKLVKEELEQLGVHVKDRYFRKKWQTNPYSILMCPKFYTHIQSLRKYAKTLGTSKPLVSALWPLLYYRMYDCFLNDSPSDLLIIDEGILQMIISLVFIDSINDNHSLSEMLLSLQINRFPICIVNCNSEEDVSKQRIFSRSLNGCRLETMSEENALAALKVQSSNFNMLRESFFKQYPLIPSISIDTKQPPKENANRIVRFINSL